MATEGRKPPVCGRLGQNEPYGLVDVCGEPHGHQVAGAGTPHVGQYHGMKWVDRPEYGQGKIRIVDPGDIMGAATREELPHQKRRSRRTPDAEREAPGFRVGKRTRRPHAPDGWHVPRVSAPFDQGLADQRKRDTERRRNGS